MPNAEPIVNADTDEGLSQQSSGQNARAAAERARAEAEAARADLEKARVEAEQSWRAAAEKNRADAEAARAEAQRVREQMREARAAAGQTEKGTDQGLSEGAAEKLIRAQSLKAAGVGLVSGPISSLAVVVPAPMLDVAGVTVVQLQMLRLLCRLYGVNYDEQMGKSLVGAIVGAYVPARLGYGGVGLAMASVPVIGPLVGIATLPGFNYASTYAMGRIFKSHFAKGERWRQPTGLTWEGSLPRR